MPPQAQGDLRDQPNSKDSKGRKSHTEYSSELFETGLFYDCVVSCQHQRWHLHRAILAQRCDFFRACFMHGFKESLPSCTGGHCEIEMDEDNPASLDRMLRWLYTLEYPFLDNITLATQSSPFGKSDVSDNFWTSELSLFVAADKYHLTELSEKVSISICNAAKRIPTSYESSLTDHIPFNSFDDFVDMLAMIYTDVPSMSTAAEQLKNSLIYGSAMTIAAHASRQPRLSNLVATIPEFATDLVEALRRIAAASASTTASMHEYTYKSGSGASQSTVPITGSANYGSGSESDGSSRSPVGPRARIYVPMNEDSDED